MTCRDMGGPCDTAMTASSADEMIKKGEEHITSMKDDAHMKVAKEMAEMTPESSTAWSTDFKKKWEAAPETK